MPERVQLKRTKGWRKPPNTVVVARPSKWGNPFRVGVDGSAAECVEAFRHDLNVRDGTPVMGANMRACLEELRGKNLACWCRLDAPCHADVLLEFANRPTCEAVENEAA